MWYSLSLILHKKKTKSVTYISKNKIFWTCQFASVRERVKNGKILNFFIKKERNWTKNFKTLGLRISQIGSLKIIKVEQKSKPKVQLHQSGTKFGITTQKKIPRVCSKFRTAIFNLTKMEENRVFKVFRITNRQFKDSKSESIYLILLILMLMLITNHILKVCSEL